MNKEIDNERTIRAFQAVLGFGPRVADLMVLSVMTESGEDPAEAIAEYLWDHWLGEPQSPSLKKVTKLVREALK